MTACSNEALYAFHSKQYIRRSRQEFPSTKPSSDALVIAGFTLGGWSGTGRVAILFAVDSDFTGRGFSESA
jgi:hypothetical protein